MHRLLSRIDEAASTAVVLIYLSAMGLATGIYFVGHSFAWAPGLALYIAFGLAAAVEVHSFLAQRRARKLYAQLHASGIEDVAYEERDRLGRLYGLALAATVGLVSFSVVNELAFWANQMHPMGAVGWAQVALRAAVVPLAFLAAGFLVPVGESVEDALRGVAADIARVMVRHASKQWRRRVRRARRNGANLAEPVAMLLEMSEAGGQTGSQIVRSLDAAIREAEGGHKEAGAFEHGTVIEQPKVVAEEDVVDIRASDDVPAKVRRFMASHPDAGVRDITRACHCSASSASKWAALVRSERNHRSVEDEGELASQLRRRLG